MRKIGPTKKVKVRFSVEYDAEIEVPVTATKLEVEDALADLDIPDIACCTYVSDSFTVVSGTDP